MTLLDDLGRGREVHEMREDLVLEAIDLLARRDAEPVKLVVPGSPHLTYCTNIHPGESWAEVHANLERYVVAVKASGRAPRRLRCRAPPLGRRGGDARERRRARAAFRAFLAAHGLYVFTINGFPYGAFHGVRVKEQVYAPDWRDDGSPRLQRPARELLAALLPPRGRRQRQHGAGRVSQPLRLAEPARAAIADRLVRHVATLVALEATTGKCIRLALEPEPWCMLETVADTVAFFSDHVFTVAGAQRLAGLTGLSDAAQRGGPPTPPRRLLRRCHMAVEFEDPAEALARSGGGGHRDREGPDQRRDGGSARG